METQENKEGGKECCSKGKCCGGKALVAIALLALGGVGGYVAGKKCGSGACPFTSKSAPAQPPAK